MTIEEYAKKILADHGCDEYTYGNESRSEQVIEDLKKGYPDGMEFPYIDVANAILAMSRPKPIVRAPYQVVWNTDDCTDGFGSESIEAAKNEVMDTYLKWKVWCQEEWEDIYYPTEEELDDYNYMINENYAYVQKYNPDTDEYEEEWWPSDEDLKKIGWEEIESVEAWQEMIGRSE